MGIKNYTTTIGVHKTLGEIQQILVDHGARRVMYDYDDEGNVSTVCFSVPTPNGDVGIKLPANVNATLEVLKQQRKSGKIKSNPDLAQAQRVAWRNIKDWTDAQMALLETQMVKFEELFLPYMTNKKGQTFFEAYQNNQLMIGGE